MLPPHLSKFLRWGGSIGYFDNVGPCILLFQRLLSRVTKMIYLVISSVVKVKALLHLREKYGTGSKVESIVQKKLLK